MLKPVHLILYTDTEILIKVIFKNELTKTKIILVTFLVNYFHIWQKLFTGTITRIHEIENISQTLNIILFNLICIANT